MAEATAAEGEEVEAEEAEEAEAVATNNTNIIINIIPSLINAALLAENLSRALHAR